jgi:type IV secretory pathway TraG/TraD family ATPase VirD4
LLGRDDDRHVVTIAGSRAGKSSTVLIPNLMRYPGSVVVLDPKGELARACAQQRHKMGQKVFVLDPFGESGVPTSARNPFSELGMGKPEHVSADAAQLADALIIGNNKGPHWTDSANNLVRGIIVFRDVARSIFRGRGVAGSGRGCFERNFSVLFDGERNGMDTKISTVHLGMSAWSGITYR